MKEKLKAMYQSGAIDTNGLLKAVERGWVTMEDVIEIVAAKTILLLLSRRRRLQKSQKAVTLSSSLASIWS